MHSIIYLLFTIHFAGVGKSSIIQRYISDTFCPSLVSTLGVDLKTKRVHVDDKNIQVQVWDTAGQAAFHKITTSYYKGSNAILLVYDISDRNTFTNIEYWVKSIREKATKDVQVALIGNKSDLRQLAGTDCVTQLEGQKAADKYKVTYVETSAMTSGTEVDEAFDKIVHKVLNPTEHSIKSRFTSDGTRSPEGASLFTKKDKRISMDKVVEGDKSTGEDSNGPTTVSERSRSSSAADQHNGDQPNGKKKECVIS
jgi:Ras-related protein Rab-1A